MRRFILLFSFFAFLFFCFAQSPGPERNEVTYYYQQAGTEFARAENAYNAAGNDSLRISKAEEIYRHARTLFGEAARRASAIRWDSMEAMASLQAALASYYVEDNDTALAYYLRAFRAAPRGKSIPDTVFFIPYIYAGSIFHARNQYDSAMQFYMRADSIQELHPRPLPESERLFNRLGVLSYEGGDYRQAGNYFEKALARTSSSNQNLVANYRMNIASILVKLKEYGEARRQYELLLPLGLYLNEIHHNLAIISLQTGRAEEALAYLKRVNYGEARRNLDLFYNYMMAYDQLGQPDSAELYYQKALAENLRYNGRRPNTPYGLLLKNRADQLYRSGRYEEALPLYQESLTQFQHEFREKDPSENPTRFSEAFSYINLFEALVGKARTFTRMAEQADRRTRMEQALDAYESAYQLAHYVERTYTSDEARLFLNQVKYDKHGEPIDLCLRLFKLTGEKEFLEAGFLFDQRNKASVLALHAQEAAIRRKSSHPLLEKEQELKSQLTRISLRAAGTQDSTQRQVLVASVRDLELELGKIRMALQQLPEFRDKMMSENIPGLDEIRKRIDHRTALISWHKSEKELVAFLVTRQGIFYESIPADSILFTRIKLLREELGRINPADKYTGASIAAYLHEKLILPIKSRLSQVERLILIPDDELNFLPFEALQDDQGRYLVQLYAIQYQFSVQFLENLREADHPRNLLAFAPFANQNFVRDGDTLSRLPATWPEIKDLEGTLLIDSQATRRRFLSEANRFGVIHLATHAWVNNESPGLSYIAFYPGDSSYKLFAREIYDMRLDSTNLVILSACETGAGKLVRGEGLMSLSRAFASAGCPNIIMSLWKAEDLVTSYLTRRFHRHRAAGATLDEALRQAKLDFLEDETMDPRFKTPNYWSHLLFIGTYEEKTPSRNWIWIAGSILLLFTGYYVFKKAGRRR